MSLIIPANTLASGGFAVDNSLRFNRGSSDYLNRTPSSAGNRKTMTYSFWLKRSAIASTDYHWFSTGGAGAVPRSIMAFESSEIYIAFNSSGSSWNEIFTNALFRDVSAWYHVVVAIDTTQSTASNRTRIYVNGSEITSFRSASYVSQNTDLPNNNSSIPHFIGRNTLTGSSYFDGYIAEAVCIDGSQLDPTSFGEFDDSGIWKPIDVSGLTFGTNGFYLETKQSGTSQNSSGLGADTSGNDNHFAVNNLTAIDQTTDTCTNNFCTMNPLDTYNSPTITDGNTVCNAGSSDKSMRSTIGISSGKWYWEVNTTANNSAYMGIVNGSYRLNTGYELSVASTNSVIWEGNGGILLKNGSTVTSSYSGGTSTYGFAFDLDNGTLKLSQNGTFYNSGNAVVTGITADTYLPVFAPNGGGSPTTLKANFGNPAYAISSSNQDGNGYGNMEYAVPSGYYALNTKNLAEYG